METFKDFREKQQSLVKEKPQTYQQKAIQGKKAARKGKIKKKQGEKKMKSQADFKKSIKGRYEKKAIAKILQKQGKTGDKKPKKQALSKWTAQNQKKIKVISAKMLKKAGGANRASQVAAKDHNKKVLAGREKEEK